MASITTIPRGVTRGEELVVIPRKEYERLQKHLTEVRDALSKIQRGEKELRTGKTRVVKSLAELR
ncbi:MAG TPA: hypothetical protein DHV62_00910 [Elusimicrobia bacterium]|jgi:PHD/YefM family antitoxin component YafN of YafNO toxin-antitoxin module|nr:hypothetical protein [Elusimicrobiota bacterium]